MAVYTQVDSTQVSEFIRPMGLGDYVIHEGITQGVENSNFHLRTDMGRYILTIFEKRIRAEDLPFVFAFTGHLAQSGMPVPDVLGQGILAGKPAAITRFLNGRDVSNPQIVPQHCAQLGNMLARMHRASETFSLSRENPVGPAQWHALYDAVKAKVSPDMRTRIEKALAEYHDEGTLPCGAIHADAFPDNVFFDDAGNLSGVIDFYFACTGPYIYDLAMTINAWCLDVHGRVDVQRLEAFAKAYESSRPLTGEERAAFESVRRAAALRILMTRLYDWYFTPEGAQVTKKDPMEYAAKLDAVCPWP